MYYRNYIITICIFSILFAYWFFFNKYSTPPPIEQKEQQSIRIQNLMLNEQSSRKDYTISFHADTADISESTNHMLCDIASCNIQRNQTTVGEISSQRAYIDKPNKIIVLNDMIKGYWQEIIITAQSFTYDYSKQHIVSEMPVQYSHKYFNLCADKSFIDIGNEIISLSEGVRSEFFIPCDTQQQQ